jgi:hypothetical protein
MTTKKTEAPAKKPRRVNSAINNLVSQRAKAISIRDKAVEEIKSYDAALLSLGWLDNQE